VKVERCFVEFDDNIGELRHREEALEVSPKGLVGRFLQRATFKTIFKSFR
jgi:hypothetical protein